MTQQQLAKATGVPQATIGMIETGARKNPRVETLYALAQALGCEVSALYKPDEEGGIQTDDGDG